MVDEMKAWISDTQILGRTLPLWSRLLRAVIHHIVSQESVSLLRFLSVVLCVLAPFRISLSIISEQCLKMLVLLVSKWTVENPWQCLLSSDEDLSYSWTAGVRYCSPRQSPHSVCADGSFCFRDATFRISCVSQTVILHGSQSVPGFFWMNDRQPVGLWQSCLQQKFRTILDYNLVSAG